jgi:hypothetical protein
MKIINEVYQDEIILGKTKLKHKAHILNALKKHGKEINIDLIRIVGSGSRTGRVYSNFGRKYSTSPKTIQASAPGEPPASRTGRLKKSFKYETSPLQLVVGNFAFSDKGAAYPLMLETGTAKMKPRPYFENTIQRNVYKLDKDLMGFR